VLLAAIVAVSVVAGGAGASPVRDLTSYEGLGTWLDVYDRPYWRAPEATVHAIASRGVRTLFLETGNSDQTTDLVRPGQLAQLVDTAHAAGLRVVAWYLPTLLYPARDLRRVLAAVRFRTPSGGRFDSFALDIEASDVRTVSLRNARLLALAAALRAAAGSTYPLGAIVPSAVGMEFHPKYWPGFPYAQLRHSVDVFLPMAYFTYRVNGRGASARYVMRSIALLRAAAGAEVPVHVIGGVAGTASRADVLGFMDAVARCGPVGFSLYDFPTTANGEWTALESPTPVSGEPAPCAAAPIG
jgi:hypothetical protein